jgi:hypothetical protein
MLRALAVLLCVLLASSGVRASGEQQERLSVPDRGYHRDPRFEKPVRFRPGTVEVRTVLEALAGATGIPLFDPALADHRGAVRPLETFAMPGFLGLRKIALWVPEVPARDLMDVLSTATGCRWYREGTHWVLADGPAQAALLGLPPEEWGRRVRQAAARWRQFTPGQLAQFRTRGVLFPEDLTPEQRQALLLVMEYYGATHLEITPEARRLEGVYLVLY